MSKRERERERERERGGGGALGKLTVIWGRQEMKTDQLIVSLSAPE